MTNETMTTEEMYRAISGMPGEEYLCQRFHMASESWYRDLAILYGQEYARIAGYFDETRPWEGSSYGEVFDLPRDKRVIQFSGAFHPFHEGHLDTIERGLAPQFYRNYTPDDLVVVVHLDHSEYRNSKGKCDKKRVKQGLKLLDRLNVPHMIVDEDKMPDGCSRNFTRLYRELEQNGNSVVFLAGGDRANYALTFRDRGECTIVGRSDHPNYKKWEFLARTCDNVIFIPADHPASSTAIREQTSS